MEYNLRMSSLRIKEQNNEYQHLHKVKIMDTEYECYVEEDIYGKPIGDAVNYAPNGVRTFRGHFNENGVLVGQVIARNEDNYQTMEAFFKDGKEVATWKILVHEHCGKPHVHLKFRGDWYNGDHYLPLGED